MRYFLIDRVTELEVGKSVRGVKCVTLSDEVIHDHFPDYPILPGALIVEGAAQLAGFLLEMTLNRPDSPPRRALLVQIEHAKFYSLCEPGDRLEFAVTLGERLEDAVQAAAEASVDGKRVARAALTFMMKDIASVKIHEQRRYLYTLWTKHLQPPPTIL
ncbi:MAG: beta-hydroxyacyl-ACP dehydratase [Elusimicrobia bacterium]|nr:beta-hydroxyacyl-ACP dehydratase [Elusimicrobiota bacterium]